MIIKESFAFMANIIGYDAKCGRFSNQIVKNDEMMTCDRHFINVILSLNFTIFGNEIQMKCSFLTFFAAENKSNKSNSVFTWT